MSQPSFFNPVSQLELDEQLQFLVNSKSSLLIKVNDKQYKAQILSKNSSRQLILSKSTNEVFSNQEASCSFEINHEQYLFNSFLTSKTHDLVLDWPTTLYRLQRRNDFRALVPTSFNYTCVLSYLNHSKINQKIQLRDMSLGGLQLQTRIKDIKPGDKLELNLKILKLDVDKLLTEVRHIKLLNDKVTYQIGVKLLDVHADLLSDLQSVIIQLDRMHRGKSYG